MARKQTVVSLDPIERNEKKGLIGRLLITRWSGGKPIKKMDPFGHYMFCGEQGSGKTSSMLWYAEKLSKKYKKKGKKIRLFSNIDVGIKINKNTLFDTINKLDPTDNEVRIVLIDEIQTYFPKDNIDKETRKIMTELIALFSQLRKRSCYILSTAQIYGRLDKSLREQCLYMIDCRAKKFNGKLVNDFIPQKNIMSDDLGRWSGDPTKIFVHGMGSLTYDTKRIIRE